MIYFDLNIEQFVQERKEIKPLRTCVFYFWPLKKIICGASVIIFALQKTVHVDTRFSTDTDALLLVPSLRPRGKSLSE